MASYSRFESGPTSEWDRAVFTSPRSGRAFPGKRFLHEALALTGMEVSLNRLEPGASVPFLHRHQQNEELYLFLSGQGEFQVDGEVFPVVSGSAVRVSPEGARSWRSTGAEALVFVVVQARAGTMTAGTVADGARVEGEPRWPSP